MWINKKIAVLLAIASISLLQAGQKEYLEGIKLYDNKEYQKAFPIIHKEAISGSHPAQYRIAEMYEKGEGIKQDYKQASYWYKAAAAKYDYVEIEQTENKDKSFIKKLENQIGDTSIKEANEFTMAKLDQNTPETKALVKSVVDNGFFGLQPYRVNYFMPISYSSEKPVRVNSAIPEQDLPLSLQNQTYEKNTEVEFQLSLKKQISYDIFGWNEMISFAYTQKVCWQMYSKSAPFRETNYMPEVFMTVPTSQSIDDATGLKAIKYGFLHQSNGQEGYRSRSWNRLYATGMWQWGNLFLATTAWYRIPESEKPYGYYDGTLGILGANEEGDDNPDILSYMGYGDIRADYLYNKHQFGLLFRNNLQLRGGNKGAVEFKWSYPFLNSPNVFWYATFFNGYGNSLIDYNRNVTKTSVGFSFSRGLF